MCEAVFDINYDGQWGSSWILCSNILRLTATNKKKIKDRSTQIKCKNAWQELVLVPDLVGPWGSSTNLSNSWRRRWGREEPWWAKKRHIHTMEPEGLIPEFSYTRFAQYGLGVSSRTVTHVYATGSRDGADFSFTCPSRIHGISQLLCGFLAIHGGSCRPCP